MDTGDSEGVPTSDPTMAGTAHLPVQSDESCLENPAGRSDMIISVGQLVSSIGTAMKNSSSTDLGGVAIENVLAQLESTDENFHR